MRHTGNGRLVLTAFASLVALGPLSCRSGAPSPAGSQGREPAGGFDTPSGASSERAARAGPPSTGPRPSPLDNSLAPFVPSPLIVVERMLELAGVTSDDVVYDLGCGDGRIVVEAAKRYGARGVGIEYDLRLCREARDRAEREGVSHLVEIRHEDVTQADFSDATVVTLYLLPASNARLKPKLLALRPGTRIVAHNYGIEGLPPKESAVVETRDFEKHAVLLWVIEPR